MQAGELTKDPMDPLMDGFVVIHGEDSTAGRLRGEGSPAADEHGTGNYGAIYRDNPGATTGAETRFVWLTPPPMAL